MLDLTLPLTAAAMFIGVGWLIVHAGEQYADAIRHTLTIFALVIGMLCTIGATVKLRTLLWLKPMTHRIEARSQVEPSSPARAVRKPEPGLNP